MKKIIIFLAFFASSHSFAQSANQNNQPDPAKAKIIGAPISNGSNIKNAEPIRTLQPPKLTPQEKALLEKNIAEQKDLGIAIKNLKPAQQKKFQDFNVFFNSKMVEYHKTLNEEIAKISKIQNLMAITTYIFKGKLVTNPARTFSKDQQDFYQKRISEYQKLPQEQKILIKKEIMKFRKNINALEKKRRQEYKLIFNKDFNNFKEQETEEEIRIDDK
jgi:hypothetical protein